MMLMMIITATKDSNTLWVCDYYVCTAVTQLGRDVAEGKNRKGTSFGCPISLDLNK